MIFNWLASDGESETFTFEWASFSAPTIEQLNNKYDDYVVNIQHLAGAQYSFKMTNINQVKVDSEIGLPIGNNVYFRCHCVKVDSDFALMSHLEHTFKQIDGSMKWPNSHEGDMLRGAYNILK
jgi:hypothetical protein